jgi:branched-chain amino acid transport system ATP-binding protein
MALLQVNDLMAAYRHLQVLWGVSLHVDEGEFVTLVGPNGAGKSTTLRSIVGLLKPMGGDIHFAGQSITGVPAHKIGRLGVRFVTEELDLFEQMTVRENLLLGGYGIRDRKTVEETMEMVLSLFPRLAERSKQLSGTLSGGERKMLAIARGLVSGPRLLLVDEPSLGLAPLLVEDVFRALVALHKQGTTILLVEQNVGAALHMSARSYVMEQGRIVMEGASADLLKDKHVKDAYLGM